MPGRKTDVKDAEWIAELLQHGLLRGSFIPLQEQRELRDLTRHRTTLVQECSRVIQRMQKVLEDAIAGRRGDQYCGLSAHAMLEAKLEGISDPATLANLAQEKLRAKHAQLVQALYGLVTAHYRFSLAER